MTVSTARLLCSEVRSTVTRYSFLEVARAEYNQPPAQLSEEQRKKLGPLVDRKISLETAIIATPEAASLVMEDSIVEAKLAEIIHGFAGPDEYVDALSAEGLTPADHRLAVIWTLCIEGVLEQVADAAPRPTDNDLRIAYEKNKTQFARPERRQVRHIMLVHSASDPSQRLDAHAKLSRLRPEPNEPVAAFELLARHHSECPSALKGGLLGSLPRGELYPELDEALFSMEKGEVRGPIVTEAGTHLLLCEDIHPAGYVPFEEVRNQLAEHIVTRVRTAAQRAWLKSLRSASRN